MGDAVWLRNQVVAPLTEVLVFRGAMLPMLVPCAGPTAAIFTAPLFFGVGMATRCSGCSYSVNTDDFMCLSSQPPSAVVPAHLHHITEQQRLHKDSMSIVLTVSGQWTAAHPVISHAAGSDCRTSRCYSVSCSVTETLYKPFI